MKLDVNANDLLVLLRLAKLSAEGEERATIQRVTVAAMESIEAALARDEIAVAPI